MDSLYSKPLDIEKSLNSALPKSQNLSIYYFVRYVCISISAPLHRLFSLGCQKYYLYPNIMEFSFFYFSAAASVSFDSLNPHKDLNFGTWDRDPANCVLKRGGGWWYGRSNDCAVWSNLNGIYPYCRKETWADIHWKNLDPNNPKGSAPTSTEMKIRPVDFF